MTTIVDAFGSCSRCAMPFGFPCNLGSSFLPCIHVIECLKSQLIPGIEALGKYFRLAQIPLNLFVNENSVPPNACSLIEAAVRAAVERTSRKLIFFSPFAKKFTLQLNLVEN